MKSTVGEVVPENVVNFVEMEDGERSLYADGADVSDVGLVDDADESLKLELVENMDETLILEDTVCVVKVEFLGEPMFGATVGAERMGVPGPTVGIPHATPPG